MPRKRFAGNTYLSLQVVLNATRCEAINTILDAGRRVIGDDGEEKEGTWHELEEAIQPLVHGLMARTKDGKTVTIYAYKTLETEEPEETVQEVDQVSK